MKSVVFLEYHEWLHKSEIEKEFLLNNQEQPVPHLVKIKEKEKESELKCKHCQREFKFFTNLKAHEGSHLPKDQRKKYECPRQFLSPVAVRGHVEREHQRELMRVRTCPICNKEYNWRAGYRFRTHLRNQKNERNWICETCGMTFLNTDKLRNHVEGVHGNRERRFQCEFCERNYLTRKNLTRHRKTAHKDEVEDEKGNEDEKRFKFVHPEYRPDFIGPRIAFPCPACQKVFLLKSRMKKHWGKCSKRNEINCDVDLRNI